MSEENERNKKSSDNSKHNKVEQKEKIKETEGEDN